MRSCDVKEYVTEEQWRRDWLKLTRAVKKGLNDMNKKLEKTIYTWERYGGYECSGGTKRIPGDIRFSAFNAIMSDGRSIEEHYQCDVKGYEPGGKNWRLGKGKPAVDPETDLWAGYLGLWEQYCKENPTLLSELRQALAKSGTTVLSDQFATSPVNQANALATLLNMVDVWD